MPVKKEEYTTSYLHNADNSAELNKISQYIEIGNFNKLQAFVNGLEESLIAEYISTANNDNLQSLLTHCTFPYELLTDLNHEVIIKIINIIGIDNFVALIFNLTSNEIFAIIEHIDKDDIEQILPLLPDKKKKEIKRTLSYPEESAARMLRADAVTVPYLWNVGDVIEFMQNNNELPEDFQEIFIVNSDFKIIGNLPINKLLTNHKSVLITDLMLKDTYIINSTMDQEEVANIFKENKLLSAPVIDEHGGLIGLITINEVIGVVEEEVEEDMLTLSGVQETTVHTGFLKTALQRMPWLLIVLLSALINSFFISIFDKSIESMIALAVLMPITAALTGNAGAQTATLTVRAISSKELNSLNSVRFCIKEFLTSIIMGTIFALAVIAIVLVHYENQDLALVFGLSLMITFIISVSSGAIIPLVMHYFNIDPAIASTIIVTSVSDILSFSLFLWLATSLLL